jgi:phosphonate transport system substrate-binding protein
MKQVLRRKALAVLSGLMLIASASVAQQRVLTVGVVPNLSAKTILTQYQPLREFLQAETKRPVEIVTASDFTSFWRGLREGAYDLSVAPPHFARLAQVDFGFKPLATYQPNIQALFVVAQSRPMPRPEALRGQCLVLANQQSLVVMRGMQWLAESGLERERDFRVVVVRTQDSIGDLLVRGECAAALLSNGEWRQVPDQHRAQLTIQTVIAEFPNFVVLARPDTDAGQTDQLRAALTRFPETTEGKAFLAATGYTAIAVPTDAQLRSLDPVLADTRRALGAAR